MCLAFRESYQWTFLSSSKKEEEVISGITQIAKLINEISSIVRHMMQFFVFIFDRNSLHQLASIFILPYYVFEYFFLGFFSQTIIWIHGNLNKLHRNSRTREKINKKKFLLALFQLASFNLLYLFCWLMIGRVSTIETCHLNNGWEIRSGGKIVEPFWRARFNNWILKHYSSTH